jgi:hypothetical protein
VSRLFAHRSHHPRLRRGERRHTSACTCGKATLGRRCWSPRARAGAGGGNGDPALGLIAGKRRKAVLAESVQRYFTGSSTVVSEIIGRTAADLRVATESTIHSASDEVGALDSPWVFTDAPHDVVHLETALDGSLQPTAIQEGGLTWVGGHPCQSRMPER